MITLHINRRPISVPEGTTVAAAVIIAGQTPFRRSITGEPRAPLCGMGICYECRLTIDGEPHRKSCQTLCQPGMKVTTDAL